MKNSFDTYNTEHLPFLVCLWVLASPGARIILIAVPAACGVFDLWRYLWSIYDSLDCDSLIRMTWCWLSYIITNFYCNGVLDIQCIGKAYLIRFSGKTIILHIWIIRRKIVRRWIFGSWRKFNINEKYVNLKLKNIH